MVLANVLYVVVTFILLERRMATPKVPEVRSSVSRQAEQVAF
jgi:hypothetical protein